MTYDCLLELVLRVQSLICRQLQTLKEMQNLFKKPKEEDFSTLMGEKAKEEKKATETVVHPDIIAKRVLRGRRSYVKTPLEKPMKTDSASLKVFTDEESLGVYKKRHRRQKGKKYFGGGRRRRENCLDLQTRNQNRENKKRKKKIRRQSRKKSGGGKRSRRGKISAKKGFNGQTKNGRRKYLLTRTKKKKKEDLILPQLKKEKDSKPKYQVDEDQTTSKTNKSDKKPEENEKKPKEPLVTATMLKVAPYCQGCLKKIHRVTSRFKGVREMSVDRQKDLVTVKGTMDVKALSGNLTERLKRSVKIVPMKKEKDKDKDNNKNEDDNKKGASAGGG